jgi:hypothetical protein
MDKKGGVQGGLPSAEPLGSEAPLVTSPIQQGKGSSTTTTTRREVSIVNNKEGGQSGVSEKVTYLTSPRSNVVAAVFEDGTLATSNVVRFGTHPTRVICQYCGYEIITGVSVLPGPTTHLWALLLLFVGCIPCVCLPYLFEDCQESVHYCPHCHRPVGPRIESPHG